MRRFEEFNREEVLEMATRGDGAAREWLLHRHRDRLRRMIAARLDHRIRARVDPSDVVQETLAMAAQALPGYLQAPPLPVLAWLRQFARERLAKLHRFHIHSRRRSVAREEPSSVSFAAGSLPELTRRLAADETSLGQGMVREEARDRVQAGLSILSDGDRAILLMRHVEQLAMADVAGSLGISEGAARVRHLRALRRLRGILDQETP